MDPHSEFDHLLAEHLALGRQYGAVQARCSRIVNAQRTRIDVLEAEVVRLRAQVVIRDSALAFARQNQAQWASSLPDLPARMALSRRVEALKSRIQSLMRERLRWEWWRAAVPAEAAPPPTAGPGPTAAPAAVPAPDELAALEASLLAADLVICQTGCLSHGAYWRVRDHCRRTGKPCMVVAQPEAVRVVRIHGNPAPAASLTPQGASAPIPAEESAL